MFINTLVFRVHGVKMARSIFKYVRPESFGPFNSESEAERWAIEHKLFFYSITAAVPAGFREVKVTA